jgi:sulfatase maturation enzyme AslB (radical SAM superfamily)
MYLLCIYRCTDISNISSSPGLPLIGNTFHAPSQAYRQYMAQQYGEIYRVRLGMLDIYMLNFPQALKEILDKQSAVTLSRNCCMILDVKQV